MDRTKIKQAIFIITYAVLIVLLVIHFDGILSFVGTFFRLLSPLFVGIAIAFVLDSPYKRLREIFIKKMKLRQSFAKGISIFFVYVITFGLIALLIRFIYPEIAKNVNTFVSNIDNYLAGLQNLINKYSSFFGLQQVDLTNLTELIDSKIDEIGAVAAGMLPKIISVTTSLVSWLTELVIAIVLSIYVMSGQEQLIRQVKRISKAYMPEKVYNTSGYVMGIVNTVFRNYVSGQVLEACILGSLCFLGMLILGLDYAALTGIIVAVTALVPILGAWIGGGLAVVLQLFEAPQNALIFFVFFMILQQVENNLIYPKVVGTKLGLPGIWVLLGVTVGGGLFGLVGMFIGVPVATVLFTLLKNDVNHRLAEEEIKETPNRKKTRKQNERRQNREANDENE